MKLLKICLAAIGVYAAVVAVIYATLGRTPATAFVLHGGAMFLPIAPDSARLSPSIRRVLAGDVGTPQPGAFAWQTTAPGFAVGELPVLVDGTEVDRLLLTRVDPARFDIVARNDATATTTVDGWARRLHARLVVNGSYYAPSGLPDTPFVSNQQKLGPTHYDARQGAFVVSGGAPNIQDLAHADWRKAMAGARDALVSYPLLLSDGKARDIKPSSWLANRTFIGLDGQGWVVFATTQDAYFSLERLAKFLERAPLDLRTVLNLDGGPVSCQFVESGEFRRRFCGTYEVQADAGGVRKLSWLYGIWTLPVVVAVVDKTKP